MCFVPRENGSRMKDWIRNRIIFILFFCRISVAISSQTYFSIKQVSKTGQQIGQ